MNKSILTVMLCATLAVTHQAQGNEIRQIMHECAVQSTIDNITFSKLSSGAFSEEDNVKDYTECIAMRLGYLNENGEFDLEDLRHNYGSRFGHDRAERFLNQCYKPRENTRNTAYNLIKCQYIYDPEHFSN